MLTDKKLTSFRHLVCPRTKRKDRFCRNWSL